MSSMLNPNQGQAVKSNNASSMMTQAQQQLDNSLQIDDNGLDAPAGVNKVEVCKVQKDNQNALLAAFTKGFMKPT